MKIPKENKVIQFDEFILKNNLEKNTTLNVLEKLQKLEPTGVFSRNLGECLRLQLKEKDLLDQNKKLLLII